MATKRQTRYVLTTRKDLLRHGADGSVVLMATRKESRTITRASAWRYGATARDPRNVVVPPKR